MASLYVLLFHEATSKGVDPGKLSPTFRGLHLLLNYGHFSVVFFIVLSGFSLMLPVARSGNFELVGGFRSYIYRRARRILPPYYVALAFSVGLLCAFNWAAQRFNLGHRIDGVTAGELTSHLLLLHNLRFDWAYRINGPMWSVATEWQIYLVFAGLMLPLCRRSGGYAMVFVAWALGSLPMILLPTASNFYWACPWFIGSFALGMLGALLATPVLSGAPAASRWGLMSALVFCAISVCTGLGYFDRWPLPLVDFIVSLFAFTLINACVASGRSARKQPLYLRVLESKVVVYLGGFSYSIYLVQHPILRFVDKALAQLRPEPNLGIVLEILIGTPIVIGVAWLFSEFFERPFSSGGVLLPALRGRWAKKTPRFASSTP